jgi:hypothetical protein
MNNAASCKVRMPQRCNLGNGMNTLHKSFHRIDNMCHRFSVANRSADGHILEIADVQHLLTLNGPALLAV